MQKRHLAGTIAAATLVFVLAIILAVSCFVVNKYYVVGWQLFPRGQEQLDLRSRAITTEEFDVLSWKMPRAEILWSVPLSGGYCDSSLQELTVDRFQPSDVEKLDYFPNLKTVNAQACTDYAALTEAYRSYPDVHFSFTLPIAGQDYAPDADTVTLKSLTPEDIRMMELLPGLTRVDGRLCGEFDLLRQLQQEHPQWQVEYLTAIAGTQIDPAARELTVTGAEYSELSVGLKAMPNLKSLTVHNPRAQGSELLALREQFPGVSIRWDLQMYGGDYADDATEVDLSGEPIGSIEEAKRVAGLFPGLKKLIVNSDGIENEAMAAYRNEVRSSYKVVWTVYFTEKCKARTDDTKFMPIEQGEYYFEEKNVYNLRYCEDMVCIDIGHSSVVNVDFVTFMPNLKYLILAWTFVTDITPLETCKSLIYLELDHSIVHDYGPLVGCTALQDLNLDGHMWESDVEPLTKMTWLKNLWVGGLGYRKLVTLRDALPDTNIVSNSPSTASGRGWRNLQGYYDMRDYLGKPYME